MSNPGRWSIEAEDGRQMCLLTIGILWKILRGRDGRHVEIGVSDVESIALDRVEDVGRVDHGPTIHLDVVATIDVKESGTLFRSYR